VPYRPFPFPCAYVTRDGRAMGFPGDPIASRVVPGGVSAQTQITYTVPLAFLPDTCQPLGLLPLTTGAEA